MAGEVRAVLDRLADAGAVFSERALVARAYDYALPLYKGRLLSTGEGALDHALGMTGCIANLNLDGDARAAGLLFAVPSYQEGADEKLAAGFNATVAGPVNTSTG